MTKSQPPYPPSDHRRDLRVNLIVEKVTLDRVRTFFGYAANISRSGMFIHTENPKEPGSQFEVEMSLPKPIDRRIRCHCEVVWQRAHSPENPHRAGMGLRFLDMPLDVANAIEGWAGRE